MPDGQVRRVDDLDAAITAAAATDVIIWHSRNADLDNLAVGRLCMHAPVIVVGPSNDVVLAKEALIAGADDYVEAGAVDSSTMHLAIECACVRAERRAQRELAQESSFHKAAKERETVLRRSLIDHLADRLHNPLTVLTLQTSILASRLPDNERHRVRHVQRATTKMRTIIDDISAAYKAETSTVQDIVPMDVGRIVKSCLERDDERIQSTAWGVRNEPAWIRSDPEVVRDLIWQILEHASLMTPSGSRAVIHVNGDDDGVTIMVHVTRQVHPQAFEPFAGLDDLTTEGGLGLELYAARGLARSVGGDVAVLADDDGSIISVRLPASARVQPSAA